MMMNEGGQDLLQVVEVGRLHGSKMRRRMNEDQERWDRIT